MFSILYSRALELGVIVMCTNSDRVGHKTHNIMHLYINTSCVLVHPDNEIISHLDIIIVLQPRTFCLPIKYIIS